MRDRPFPLDLVPRIIPAAEWTTIKRGLAQRIRALNQFIDDVYHGREIVHDGLVPWELIVSRSGFARAAHGIRPPGGVYMPRVGLRPRARRRRLVEGARGQRAHAERDLLRAREPGGDDAAAARAVLPLPRAAGRPLPGAAAHRALAGGADGRGGGGDGRRVDAGPVQLRLLRARLPRAADGRRAGRGVGPRGARRGLPHAHHARAPARARDLPPDRRRLHGPARVPARLDARRARG